jgi:hypothetical protein
MPSPVDVVDVAAAQRCALSNHLIEVLRNKGPGWLSPASNPTGVASVLECMEARLRTMAKAETGASDLAKDVDEEPRVVGVVDRSKVPELIKAGKRALARDRKDLRKLRESRERTLARAQDREQMERWLQASESLLLQSEECWVRRLAEHEAVIKSPPEWRWVWKWDPNHAG